MGEVVNVKSANGDITHHEGKVFVQWDDGKFRPIHSEHLRLATTGKTAKVRVLDKHGPVPDEMEGMAKEILAAYTKAVPMLRGYIRNITVTAYKGDTFHITVIAPGWSIHIDEERPGFDLDTADTFNKQQDKGEAAMEAVARRYGYRPSGAGKWLANKEGQKIMLGLAGGGGRAASDRQAGTWYVPTDNRHPSTDPRSVYFEGHSKARRILDNIAGTRNPRKREELFKAWGTLTLGDITLDEAREYKRLEKRYRKPGWRKELPTKHASDLKADFEKIKALAEKKPDSKFLKSLLKQMADKGFAPTDKQMAVVKKIEGEAKEMATMQKELKSLGKAADYDPTEIGKRKGGPMTHDPEDKNIMGHFGQGELHDMTEIAKQAFFRVGALGDLRAFLQRNDGKLVHKSTNDLWSYAKDAEGGFIVSRLFDDTGEPLKG